MKISKKMLMVFVAATLAGACLHFVYDIFPNPATAVFSPVNESLWEHLKILFWPYLAGLLVLTKGGEKGCRAAWLLTLLLLCAAMLGLGYLYHIVLYGESLMVDVGIYVLLMAAGFVLPGVLRKTTRKSGLSEGLALAVAVLGAAMVLFTFLPPDLILFTDLSGAHTWVTNPYC